jgi:hypothetical protein
MLGTSHTARESRSWPRPGVRIRKKRADLGGVYRPRSALDDSASAELTLGAGPSFLTDVLGPR